MPTLPSHHGCAASQSMTSQMSAIVGAPRLPNAPPDLPVPRTFTSTWA